MKKKIALILALCLCLLLTSCGSPGTGGTSVDADGLDYNQYVYQYGWMAYTENAVILFNKMGWNWITYLPLSLTEPASPICTKVDCDHRDSSCNAYVEAAGGIYVWQDHIYYVARNGDGLSESLYRMELDGTGRTEVRVLEMTQGYSSTGGNYRMSGGWLILEFTINRTDSENTTLYLVSLEDPDADPIALYTTDTAEDEDGRWSIIPVYCWILEDWTFFTVSNYDEGIYRLYARQFSTGETALLSEQWDGEREITYRDGTFYWIKDGTELGTLDPETGEQTVITSELGPAASEIQAFDDQYVYVGIIAEDEESADAAGAEPGVYVYNYEGDFLQYIPYPEGQENLLFALSTPDYLIFSKLVNNSTSFQLPIVGYLEKSAFADGTAEFILLE